MPVPLLPHLNGRSWLIPSSDDSFIVSPFKDGFQSIPDVPYEYASKVLSIINAAPSDKKRRDLGHRDFSFTPMTGDVCPEGTVEHAHDLLKPRSQPLTRGLHRRQTAVLTPGYVTKGIYIHGLDIMPAKPFFLDDFGTDGDDTIHSKVPNYPQPEYLQANASFPADHSVPATVDLVFLDYIATDVLAGLTAAGVTKTAADVSYYLPQTFTTNSYLPAYAKIAWQANVPNCPVGEGVGAN